MRDVVKPVFCALFWYYEVYNLVLPKALKKEYITNHGNHDFIVVSSFQQGPLDELINSFDYDIVRDIWTEYIQPEPVHNIGNHFISTSALNRLFL